MRISKLLTLLGIILGLSNCVIAQETIKVMQYNLLYYGKNVGECNSSTNYIVEKNENLKKIIKHVQPDIFSVNELDGEGTHPESDDATYLLNNALNVDGVNYYQKTDFPKVYLANTLFYNANKLVLKSHTSISFYSGGYPKIFNVYKFYFNSDDLETNNDTAFFSCLVAHLKAGNYPDNEELRAYEAQQIMNYYESLGEKGNYLLMGDFNVYSPNEECFQAFINPDNSNYKFNDPANQIGEWSKNYDYRYYHTQSTHTNGECFSTGGMDDRFDFILASDNIMNGTDHFTYVDNSYKVIGQDGSMYNSSLNMNSNSVVPNDIAQALYNMSDHLPVYMEMKVDQNLGAPLGIDDSSLETIQVSYENPVSDYLKLRSQNIKNTQVEIDLISLNGIKVYGKVYNDYNDLNISIPLNEISSGFYILKIITNEGFTYSNKVLVKK